MFLLKLCVLAVVILAVLGNDCPGVPKKLTVKVFKDPSADEEHLEVASLSTLTDYETIAIENENIEVLCENFVQNLPKLKVLDLSHLGIKTIKPGAFKNVPNLQILNLSKNKLTNIIAGVFNHLNLENLHLDGNKITHIDSKALDDMQKLELFEANTNDLTSIDPEWFKGCPNLYSVSFDHNKIEEVPANAFKHISKKNVNIRLSNNHIKEVKDNSFSSFDTVSNIYLEHNNLGHIGLNAFNHINHGTKLNLSGNKLTCLDAALLDKLKIFDKVCLASNSLSEGCLTLLKNHSNVSPNSCT